ncbi:hypothetical protein CX029_00935 [Vibrio cholerae]|nr:hypothetical protein [Vibrio cholerae]MEB3775412.1 hypothetical protein [Vibrio sp. R-1]EGQ7704689.1 hypothetical protein [Vibrio cholerae]EGQ9437525.1 hypothetical protein [Vibrio cholerae]EGR0590511.1 hypothetical protein [Vibrio cholerae]EGR1262647.1 hypothetical protein [Vibrio cholerae]
MADQQYRNHHPLTSMKKSLLAFFTLVFVMVLLSIWAMVRFTNTYNMLTKYTQLAAWSLAQLEQLKQLGVDEFQGYYFSRPITKTEFATFCDHYFSSENTSLSTQINE